MDLLALATDGPIPQNLSILDPVSPPATAIRSLFWLILAITGGIFLVVEGVLIYSIIKFGRNANARAIEPPQVYGSTPIEIAWTVAPTLIVFVLVLVVVRTEWEVRANPSSDAKNSEPLHVTVVGHQWWWEYRYEKYGDRTLDFITANELHIPVDDLETLRPVYLTLKSADVCHSFWVPRLAGKTDLIPGRDNIMWFQTTEPGLYLGQCAEYCGTQHANMLLRVVAEPAADFETWLANESKPAVEDPAAEDDRATFLAQSCINCHRVRGTPARGTYAPDLTHLMARKTLASGMVKNGPDELRRWIQDPQPVKPGCLMPAFGLSDKDLDKVVRYLATLR